MRLRRPPERWRMQPRTAEKRRGGQDQYEWQPGMSRRGAAFSHTPHPPPEPQPGWIIEGAPAGGWSGTDPDGNHTPHSTEDDALAYASGRRRPEEAIIIVARDGPHRSYPWTWQFVGPDIPLTGSGVARTRSEAEACARREVADRCGTDTNGGAE